MNESAHLSKTVKKDEVDSTGPLFLHNLNKKKLNHLKAKKNCCEKFIKKGKLCKDCPWMKTQLIY